MHKKRTILILGLISLLSFMSFSICLVAAAPTVTTGPATNITSSSATLSASFNVDDEDSVVVYFEIDNTQTSKETYTSSGTHTQTVSNLSPSTQYQYRAVLQYTRGWWFWTRTYTVYGNWQTFTTEESGPPPPPPPPPDKDPILFVHGYTGSASNWNTMRERFIDAGYSSDLLYAFTFDNPNDAGSGSNADNAEEVLEWIIYILSLTGASEVDIVAHSMGGLSTRYYIKFLGGAQYVDDYVSLGTPQHGTRRSFYGDMRIGSSFLNQLNSGDETPSGVEWTTVRSTADTLVVPTDTAMLDGANNILITGVGHLDMPGSDICFSIALTAVSD